MKVKCNDGTWKKLHIICGSEDQKSPLDIDQDDKQMMWEMLMDLKGWW